ncbi:MAG: Forkhead-associated protein [Schlesneria sp.]|nr:Forkhead-associated protein [Schlesneria sp.]
MQARLKVLHDKASVKHVKLLPVTLIGRSTECNLKIASSQVSRNHCRITLGADSVFVEDLGSANGTLVDGQLIPPHQPIAIAPGARLIVGPAEFQIDYVASTSATMVLSRTGVPPQPELPPTEVISHVDVSSIAVPPPPVATPVAVAQVVAVAVAPVIAAGVAPAEFAPPQELFAQPISQAAPGDTVELEPGTSFPETQQAPEASSEDTMFMFQETLPETEPEEEAAVPEAPAKKGGLKSLFSMFGRKVKPATDAAADQSAVATPGVFLPTVEAVAEVVDEPAIAADPVEVEENAEEEAPSEGGFDDFLSQFQQ